MEPTPLKEFLKAKGLDLAEDTAKLVLEAIFDFAEQYVKHTENKTDDALFAGIVPLIRPMLLDKLDKIDKVEG